MRFESCARVWLVVLMPICVSLSACDQPLSPSTTTGLTGVVVRGPMTPVCRIDVPCDAPFSATFSVDQNGSRITEFQSDVDGRFAVTLPAGNYLIVPGADAPILSPSSQAKMVEVLAGGLTEVRLAFDTGIR